MTITGKSFVVEAGTGRVAMVLKIYPPTRYRSIRLKIEYEDHSILDNAPKYLYREATETEVDDALLRMNG